MRNFYIKLNTPATAGVFNLIKPKNPNSFKVQLTYSGE